MNDVERFFNMLEKTKYHYFWDKEKEEINLNKYEEAKGLYSSGEMLMLDFLASIWLGQSKGFDLIEAVKTLDQTNLTVVQDWIADPFFP